MDLALIAYILLGVFVGLIGCSFVFVWMIKKRRDFTRQPTVLPHRNIAPYGKIAPLWLIRPCDAKRAPIYKGLSVHTKPIYKLPVQMSSRRDECVVQLLPGLCLDKADVV
ncbi:hypothetical protein Bpfe_017809 [Biomphalaria pfeifferi]|uniref:Uncharacterized protein n=1 Tax=Biomphalaria pfeifferi TaxID=112525 RepID=A0AAD8BDQ6_BIOPF|nr:hypothetical protein Bpfe_017809 [Biomphalaria pfeifferi]